ncbi:TetR/AcrR family transcriptional regulator [Tardiphaga sp. OK245]|jgi:AcrR family transcriptional regulator|uniref:TetR/AcrR family transcriptional regulator n=1 Tax=unclassified Tardiphaga TaxID=2631404 RepID=UPI0008A78766|nr:TetR/AcrR family transcriptional regulator [Tardiphaga sp. OK245]SEI19373.1 transcriptional regulator, TetR family [Tardiphaga sp. OK245]
MSKSAKPPPSRSASKLPARKRAARPSVVPRAAKGRTATSPKTYHHGDLRRVLIAAALELAEEGGADAVSVREAARRAGVSPGAPFRHFPSRNDLMSAVAEEAQRRFRVSIAAAIAGTSADDPLARFRAFGMAYMRWAMTNPAHFEVISSGKYFSHDQSEALREDNDELIAMTEQLLMDALAQGQLRSSDLRVIKIAGRALVYGFARMNIDGHFPRWGVANAEADQMAEAIITLFVDGIARPV